MKLPRRRERTLEELEGDRWPTPPADTTRLIATAHALRQRPVGELTAEDLRLLIGQDVGLPHLLPLAVDVLRVDPMAEGDMYEGALLCAVLTRDPAVWSDLPELHAELRAIVAHLGYLRADVQQKVRDFLAA
ncbi:contact-dependent growth inhibition system immunity protein [Streptomyces antibioticus]|uniref:contact-dependent growth inhibition system immunity protein n=1 Tax=Streptomyces antibioticus TaxID=1890 RepID=UPI001960DB8A|nr:hypothetical protein [Streptomyces sp. S9]